MCSFYELEEKLVLILKIVLYKGIFISCCSDIF